MFKSRWGKPDPLLILACAVGAGVAVTMLLTRLI